MSAVPSPTAAPPDPSLPPPSPAPRLDFIDGLRGLAMLLVLCFHAASFGGGWGLAQPVVGRGYVGVNLFLVLSGFCLYWPFVAPRPEGLPARREPTLGQFARKRCRRILPPYYAALLFFWSLLLLDVATHHHLHEDATGYRHVFLSLGWHLALLHNLRPEYATSIDGVFWSLALEASLYVLFPLLVEAFRRWGPWLSAGGVLLVNLAWGEAVRRHGPFMTEPERFGLANCLFGRCFEFAAGMAAARMVARGRVALWPALALCLAAAVGAGWATAMFGPVSALANVLCGLSFAALVVAAAAPAGWPHRALSARWLAGLGAFSYSVYLIHLPFVRLLDALAARLHFSPLVFGPLGVVPLCLALGYLFHLRFEKPFLRPARS